MWDFIPAYYRKEILKHKMSKKTETNCRLGAVGGQAVMEGVMMRHGNRCSIAVRKEDGTITVKNDNYVPLRKKHKICNLPILRGAINMVEMLMLSVRTLNDSVEMLGLEEELESVCVEDGAVQLTLRPYQILSIKFR